MSKANFRTKYKHYNHTQIRSPKTTLTTFLDGLNHVYYPDIGTYIIKSKRLYLAITSVSKASSRQGCHAHNDCLSFELTLDGKDLFLDPGTYLYTASPEQRNLFRSTAAHHGITVSGKEQNRWITGLSGLFSYLPEIRCSLLKKRRSKKCFEVIFHLKFRGISQIRSFQVHPQELIIDDYSSHPFVTELRQAPYYSNGYGKIEEKDYGSL